MRIYLDNHATTKKDPRVLSAMMPYLQDEYANAGSVTHEFGREIAVSAQTALFAISSAINATREELVITSGATESANLAIFGTCLHPRMKRRRIVAARTEHRAVLDPLERLAAAGFEIDWLQVAQQGSPEAGVIDLEHAAQLINDQTALVCLMLVNNEIGVIQPIRQVAELAQQVGAIMFCDATAGCGRLAVDVKQLGVDLLGFSAHKFYGPKGIGALYVNGDNRSLRLRSQILGGGQQRGLRSGTLNVPGLIGMSRALQICEEDREGERLRLSKLQRMFHDMLVAELGGILELNGPAIGDHRVLENLNYQWPGVEGQSLMLAVPEICFSSGSACSAAEQTVSHVLTSIGLDVDSARCSTRFGLGRFTAESEITFAAERLASVYKDLMSNLS